LFFVRYFWHLLIGGLFMADAKTRTNLQDQASPTSPAPAQTLSSEEVLDALKLMLLGAPLNEVLTSVTHLIEAHSEGMSCGRGGGGRWNGLSRWFTGPNGVFEDGAYGEWLAVRKESVCLIPQGVDDVSAAGIPIAYLTAHMALTLAGFQPGKTVLARAIGGSVGNAVTQLARALGAKHAVSSTTNHEKAQQAKALGFDEVIDVSREKLGDGVRRMTDGYGADIVIDAIGGEDLSEALATLAPGGSLTTLGYSAGRKTTIDVTDLIWKRASIKSFSLFAQPQAAVIEAWKVIAPLLQSGAIKPIVAKPFPLAKAAEALRYLVEGRPFGRVVVTI
jgi:NADPH2:quinone reductase